MIKAAEQHPQVVVRLVDGLPADEAVRILAASVRDKGLENRIQAFYLHDMKLRRSYQELGFSSVEALLT